MKPLLRKTIKPFLIYVLIVLAVSIPVYYFVIDTIWKAELDEHNKIIVDKTAHGLNQLKLPEEKLQSSIELWNNVQPGTSISKVNVDDNNIKDSVFTIYKQKSYTATTNIDRFRCLSTVIYINNRPYRFLVETNIEETRETVAVIAVITVFFFIIIVAGLLFLTRRLSDTVWLPFHDTLSKLRTFNLNTQTKVHFTSSDTTEFEQLNQSLSRLIEHNVSVYKSQKEFTENASHELQTPLAILKSKLDILLQSDDLTEKQYNLAEEMNKVLTRSSRINKNLLLLAKIDNNQFDHSELIKLDILLGQSLFALKEHFEQKKLQVNISINADTQVKVNNSLAEILVNNLLLNAIRYSMPANVVTVALTKEKLTITNHGTMTLNAGLLFKRFSRQSADNNGSGLGLVIVREICDLHGWEIAYRFENDQHIFSVSFFNK